jgi:regulator of protease activity HflC (stomatin/prohibitin superfamily)
MATTFDNKLTGIKGVCNKIVAPLAIVMIILALCGWGGGTSFIIGSLLLVVAMLPNFIWLVPTGWVGFKAVFGKVRNQSYRDGLHLKVPFITDTFLTDLRVQTKKETDTKKVLTRNNVTLEYTLTYQVDEAFAHLLFRYFGENYYTTHLHQWVDAVFDTFVSRLTYPQLQTQKESIEAIASALIRQEVDVKCGEASKMDGTHTAYRCEFSSDDTIAVDLDEDGSTEDIPKLDLAEWMEDDAEGVNFFKSFDLKINKVTFENGYEEARAKVAVAKAEVAEAEQKKKQAIIFAEGQKEVARIKAEGEAEAIRLQGAAENEVKEVLGSILKNNPSLIKEVLAKNFPKVFGGNTMVNLDSMLGGSSLITPDDK